MTVLKVENLSVMTPKQPKQHLVDSVSFALEAGEILAIIGPNGAGKSSLIKAVIGDWPYTGLLQISNLVDKPTHRARQLAVLPQQSLLNFPYTVQEVVGLSRIPHQTGAQRDIEIINQALALMDISALKQRIYTQLSGGEKQRVQLARVFAQIWDAKDADNGTRLLILDEPTTALDLGHQQALMSAIKDFASHGVAVIMVLHDVNLASRYADKILALLQRQTLAFGTPNDVISEQNMQLLYELDAHIIAHPQDQKPIVVGV